MFDLGGWHIGVYLMIAIDVSALVILGLAIAYGSRMAQDAQRDFAPVRRADRRPRRLYQVASDRSLIR